MSPQPGAARCQGRHLERHFPGLVWWGFPLGAPDRSWLPGMLWEACEALIPLYRICDTAAVFACSMLSPPLFPARTQYSSEAAVALEALQDSPEQKIQLPIVFWFFQPRVWLRMSRHAALTPFLVICAAVRVLGDCGMNPAGRERAPFLTWEFRRRHRVCLTPERTPHHGGAGGQQRILKGGLLCR